MPASSQSKDPAGVRSSAVQARTGKTWPEWIAALDGAGGQGLAHREIVDIVRDRFSLGPWWQPMVTVGYKQAPGLRNRHQKTNAYAVSAGRTLAVPVARLFAAGRDPWVRRPWLAGPLTIRKATPDKSRRFTWGSGPSALSVGFHPTGPAKCQAALQHDKLAGARAGARLRKFWKERRDCWQELLEKA